MNVQRTLKKLRKTHTVPQLAAKLGVTRRAIYRYLAGTRSQVSYPLGVRIARLAEQAKRP